MDLGDHVVEGFDPLPGFFLDIQGVEVPGCSLGENEEVSPGGLEVPFEEFLGACDHVGGQVFHGRGLPAGRGLWDPVAACWGGILFGVE